MEVGGPEMDAVGLKQMLLSWYAGGQVGSIKSPLTQDLGMRLGGQVGGKRVQLGLRVSYGTKGV